MRGFGSVASAAIDTSLAQVRVCLKVLQNTN